MVSAMPPSVTEAARWLPSGLTEEDMILPLLMTQSITDRVDVLVTGYDQALISGLADLVGAERMRGRVRDPGAGADDGQSSGTGNHQANRRPASDRRVRDRTFGSRRRWRVTCIPYPFRGVASRSTVPSTCQRGLGASPVGVRTRK